MTRNKKTLLIIGGISLLIPLFYITFIVFTVEEDSTTVIINTNLIVYTVIAYYILLIVLIITYAIHWTFKQVRQLINLKHEKAKTELMHLQSQVNPHFFFNILNNLYGLVDKDSEKAKKLILKLSDMMRYSIYEGQKEYVTLQQEIDFLSNYIELHKMRYQKSIDVNLDIDIKDKTLKIMPLIFIVLIENAFKHGVEVLRKEAFIHLKLKADKEKVNFEVKNNFDKTHTTEKGIGLKNLKRRLELGYPNKNSFTTNINDNNFNAILEIQV